MAARRLHLDDNDNKENEPESPILNSKGQPLPCVITTKTIKQRIEEDPSPLVRYCLMESEWRISDAILNNPEPEMFFALPHDARLAKIRLLDCMGEKIASLISYGVDHLLKDGKVTETELFEILSDYICKPSFRDHYSADRWQESYGGYGEFLAGKDIEALWKLVPKLPEGIAHVLIDHLPFKVGLSNGIPKNVLDEMTTWQLAKLLYRDDVPLEEFRKELFLRPVTDRLDEIRSAAIAHHFDFTYAEFKEILIKSEQEKIDLLRDLAVMANDLSLVFFDAIHDVLLATEVSFSGGAWEDAAYARSSLKRKLGRLKGWQRTSQLRELRLYRLAEQSVPWKTVEAAYQPRAELEFLSKLIVKNDTWATFMAFSKAWEHRHGNKAIEKYLPRINEAGEDNDEEDNNELGIREAKESLDEKLSTILSKLKDKSNEGESKLAEAFSDLASYTTKAIEKSLEAMNDFKSEIVALRRMQSSQRSVLIFIIGLLVWLIIKKW